MRKISTLVQQSDMNNSKGPGSAAARLIHSGFPPELDYQPASLQKAAVLLLIRHKCLMNT